MRRATLILHSCWTHVVEGGGRFMALENKGGGKFGKRSEGLREGKYGYLLYTSPDPRRKGRSRDTREKGIGTELRGSGGHRRWEQTGRRTLERGKGRERKEGYPLLGCKGRRRHHTRSEKIPKDIRGRLLRHLQSISQKNKEEKKKDESTWKEILAQEALDNG